MFSKSSLWVDNKLKNIMFNVFHIILNLVRRLIQVKVNAFIVFFFLNFYCHNHFENLVPLDYSSSTVIVT